MATRRERATEPARALPHRRELRQRSTEPEQLLWGVLRNRRLGGHKFRRQHSVGAFIVDFVCVEQKLVIELDGGYHDYVAEEDLARQKSLERAGYRVLRFANEDVLADVEAVAIAIGRSLTADAQTPSP